MSPFLFLLTAALRADMRMYPVAMSWARLNSRQSDDFCPVFSGMHAAMFKWPARFPQNSQSSSRTWVLAADQLLGVPDFLGGLE